MEKADFEIFVSQVAAAARTLVDKFEQAEKGELSDSKRQEMEDLRDKVAGIGCAALFIEKELNDLLK